MFPRIKKVEVVRKYVLYIEFADGKNGFYDVGIDIDELVPFRPLRKTHGLFEQVQLDESGTCIFWNENIDLPSDAIYENLEESIDKCSGIN